MHFEDLHAEVLWLGELGREMRNHHEVALR
jgi:hypothetical protein